jgi:protein-disulfide isomerase
MKLSLRLSFAILIALAAQLSALAQTRTAPRPTPRAAGQTKAPASTPSPTPARALTGSGTTRVAPSPSAASAGAAPADACACEPGPLPEVLAVVNGVRVTQADLNPAVRQRIDQLKQEVIDSRAEELDLQINSRLLAAEAKKRGTTTVKLLEQEVVAKMTAPTEAEAKAYFEQNRARVEAQAGRRVEFAELRENVIEYLRGERQRVAAKQYADRLRASAAVKKNVEQASAATASDRAKVLATVNGESITSAHVEDSLRPLVYAVQEQVFGLRKQEVDLRINDVLLEQEAQKLKVTMQSLLDSEVKAKLPVVTEADAQKFYNENKERINGDFAQLKYQIIQHLEEQAAQRTQAAFAQRLRNAASIQTFITPPIAPVFEIATDDQPAKGSPSAAVTIVEFTDYQCPSCAATHPVLDRIAAEYADRVRLVVRDFPLAQHENAFKAAEAAEAAREQGKYWEYVSILFRNQSALAPDQLKMYAGHVGLDRARFDAALDTGKFAEKVQRDLEDGQRLGVNATPTLFVNGRRIGDRTYEGLKLIIEDALKTSAKR